MPLANAFLERLDGGTSEPAFPLDVYFCETCSLVQLLDVIDPEILFRNYIYVTGTSETIARHNIAYARTVVDLLRMTERDRVVEIASNDGSLLRCFKELGVRTLGVEPAENIAALATASGIDTVNRFFDEAHGRVLRDDVGSSRAVIANNVLAHVDDTIGFLRGCRHLVDDGLVIVEVPYVREMLDRLEYDTIYHEHLCYFSVRALLRLFSEAGLTVVRVERVSVHGGSIRVYAGRPEHWSAHSDVAGLAASEEREGLTSLRRYQQFASGVEENRQGLRTLLESFVAQGKTIAAYGAPAKGNTLLNYCGIGPSLVAYAVDKNPLKVGRWTPGVHLPVLPVETVLERQPDYLLILAWNFADEIIAQQTKYAERGGRFILPIPVPRVIEARTSESVAAGASAGHTRS